MIDQEIFSYSSMSAAHMQCSYILVQSTQRNFAASFFRQTWLFLADDKMPASTAVVLKDRAGENKGAFDLLGFLQTKDPKAEHPEVGALWHSPSHKHLNWCQGTNIITQHRGENHSCLMWKIFLPQIAAEKSHAAAKRGQEATQTSDAKFDAQFAFGHGLAGEANMVRKSRLSRWWRPDLICPIWELSFWACAPATTQCWCHSRMS